MMPDLGTEESGVHWLMGQTNQSGHCGEMGDCTYIVDIHCMLLCSVTDQFQYNIKIHTWL